MKKKITLIFFLTFTGVLFAQNNYSEEAKKKKNIEAGNPFKKFGSNAKVATLSKGKYLEIHDLDTIVVIGTSIYHPIKKKVIGSIEMDSVRKLMPTGDVPSRWLSVDPLAEEFPSWSPYTFVYNSPLKYVDPDGRAAIENEDLFINGEGADQAFQQLQAASSLKLSRNAETGQVTAQGKASTSADKELLSAIQDKNVIVNINSTLGIKSTDGTNSYLTGGGSFDGSVINANKTATANQTVNPDFAGRIDNFEGTKVGVGVMHETLEAYQEGKRAFASQTPSGPADPKNNKAGYLNYQKAHGAADKIDPRHVRTYEYFVGRSSSTGKEAMVLEKPNGQTMILYKFP